VIEVFYYSGLEVDSVRNLDRQFKVQRSSSQGKREKTSGGDGHMTISSPVGRLVLVVCRILQRKKKSVIKPQIGTLFRQTLKDTEVDP